MKRLVTGCAALALLLGGLGQARAANIVSNPGFETGALAPWFQDRDFTGGGPKEDWNVTSADAHSGTFSATDVGNLELRQDLPATPTASITEVSFWARHPDGPEPLAYDLFYSNGNDDEFVVFPGADWTFIDATSNLEAGTNLVAISVFGVSGGSPSSRTFVDDFTVNGTPASAVPEPATLTLLGLGALSLAGYAWRRKQQPSVS